MIDETIGYNKHRMSTGGSKIKVIKFVDNQKNVAGLTKAF